MMLALADPGSKEPACAARERSISSAASDWSSSWFRCCVGLQGQLLRVGPCLRPLPFAGFFLQLSLLLLSTSIREQCRSSSTLVLDLCTFSSSSFACRGGQSTCKQGPAVAAPACSSWRSRAPLLNNLS